MSAKWTDRPQTPGFYWQRTFRGFAVVKLAVIEIFVENDQLLWSSTEGDGGFLEYLPTKDCLWLPIEEPA